MVMKNVKRNIIIIKEANGDYEGLTPQRNKKVWRGDI